MTCRSRSFGLTRIPFFGADASGTTPAPRAGPPAAAARAGRGSRARAPGGTLYPQARGPASSGRDEVIQDIAIGEGARSGNEGRVWSRLEEHEVRRTKAQGMGPGS